MIWLTVAVVGCWSCLVGKWHLHCWSLLNESFLGQVSEGSAVETFHRKIGGMLEVCGLWVRLRTRALWNRLKQPFLSGHVCERTSKRVKAWGLVLIRALSSFEDTIFERALREPRLSKPSRAVERVDRYITWQISQTSLSHFGAIVSQCESPGVVALRPLGVQAFYPLELDIQSRY